MFTGIITELGKVKKIEILPNLRKFTILTTQILKDKNLGDSIAINGACMTITALDGNAFTVDTIQESLEKTNLGDLKEGEEVNLESPLKLNQGLDGHIVQGHVDCTGRVKSLAQEANKVTLEIEFPENIAKYIAPKGSITINGVSLTVASLSEKSFTVELIPLTMEKTNLKNLQKDAKVNLEIDIIARYLERLNQYGN